MWHGEYNKHELDESGVFFKRFARPPLRDVMSNQNVANRNFVPRAFNGPLESGEPLQLLTNTFCDQLHGSPSTAFSTIPRMTCTYCGVFKLSQEILHVWPRDSEEVSQSGSIVSIKVVRNLFEEVGKGDGHDQPCARDITNRRVPQLSKSTQC